MQPKDFHRQANSPSQAGSKQKKSKFWWLLSGGLALISMVVIVWLMFSRLPTLLLPLYPEVIVVIPNNSIDQIDKLVVLILNQDAHRTYGYLLRSREPISINSKNENAHIKNQEISFAMGLIVNQVINIQGDQINYGSLKWQFWRMATQHWQQPQDAVAYLKLSLLTPNLQDLEVQNFKQWGKDMAKKVRPLELRSRKCILGVSNTIGLSGLGRKYADFLTEQGAVVKRITNQSSYLPNSQVLIDEKSRESCEEIVPVIRQLLSSKVPITHQSGIGDQYRVSMMLLLGTDSAGLASNQGTECNKCY